MNFELEIAIQKDIEKYIDLVAQWRIEQFREFPYLYQGNSDYERRYLKHYAIDPKATFVIAREHGEIAGVVTGLPLSSESNIVADLKHLQKNELLDEYYYLGEIIIPPRHRGKGLMRNLCEKQEIAVKAWGFKKMCLLTVVREKEHSLIPANYKSSDDKFAHLGYHKTDITTEFHWPTIQADGTVKDIKNPLVMWVKSLF